MSHCFNRLHSLSLAVVFLLLQPAVIFAQLPPPTLGNSIGGIFGPAPPAPNSSIGGAVAALIAANKKRANSYLESASVIVFGQPRGVYQVLSDMSQLTDDGSPQRNDVMMGHFSLLDAIAFEKAKLANPALSGIRQATIENAFQQVYGRTSTPLEQAQYDPRLRAGKLWYAPLVLQEQERLNADKQVRGLLVAQVYQRALGRPGTPAEVGFWLQRTEDYSGMIAAARNWLYSPPGAKDLIETVTRAQQARNRPTDSAAIKLAMAQYEPTREIYVEMVGIGLLFKK